MEQFIIYVLVAVSTFLGSIAGRVLSDRLTGASKSNSEIKLLEAKTRRERDLQKSLMEMDLHLLEVRRQEQHLDLERQRQEAALNASPEEHVAQAQLAAAILHREARSVHRPSSGTRPAGAITGPSANDWEPPYWKFGRSLEVDSERRRNSQSVSTIAQKT